MCFASKIVAAGEQSFYPTFDTLLKHLLERVPPYLEIIASAMRGKRESGGHEKCRYR